MNNQYKIIVANELRTDLRSKSFWIATFLLPVLAIAFGVVIGLMAQDSSALETAANPIGPDKDDMTASEALAMILGSFITIFIMVYGSQIFNKVKSEKSNRIVEIIASCVPGRTMMLAKVTSVGLTGLIQMGLWALLIIGILMCISLLAPDAVPWADVFSVDVLLTGLFSLVFFAGGFVFWGSLFAAVGAMSDANNENQEYMTILVFMLMATFYIAAYSIDMSGASIYWLMFIPFTSAGVSMVQYATGTVSAWITLVSGLTLCGFAWGSAALAGKIYTSALLLRGTKLKPRDIMVFLRSK